MNGKPFGNYVSLTRNQSLMITGAPRTGAVGCNPVSPEGLKTVL